MWCCLLCCTKMVLTFKSVDETLVCEKNKVPVVIWQYNMHPRAWLTDTSICWVIHLTDCISKWASGIHDTFGTYIKFFTGYHITNMCSTNYFILLAFPCDVDTNFTLISVQQATLKLQPVVEVLG